MRIRVKGLVVLAVLVPAPAVAAPVSLVCDVRGSNATVSFDEATGRVSQNGEMIRDAAVGPERVVFSMLNEESGRHFESAINRRTGQIIVTVRDTRAASSPVIVRMTGTCLVSSQRAF